MLTFNSFLKLWKKHQFPFDQTLYLAISGGVDSIVLLDLIHQLPRVKPIVLLHVNYGLRKQAQTETQFVKALAEKYHCLIEVSYFKEQNQFTEALGRDFRYAFFKERVKKEGVLLTAHHQNDLAETLLMKLTRGTALHHLAFLPQQPFGKGQLIRPLLPFSKEEIYQYAQYHHLHYFEDESNKDVAYTRNRYRHIILPLLQKENPQVFTHFSQLNQELLMEKPYHKEEPFSLTTYPFLSPQQKVDVLFQWLKKENITLKEEEQFLLLSFLVSSKKKCTIGHYRYEKQKEKVEYKKIDKKDPSPICKYLTLNQWHILSKTEKIGLFKGEIEIPLPEQGTCHILPLYQKPNFPLCLRYPLQNDRLQLKKEGYTKKLRRYFIDQKIPYEKRKETYIVADKKQNVIWIIPNGKSYLSYNNETDKILYRLVYCKK